MLLQTHFKCQREGKGDDAKEEGNVNEEEKNNGEEEGDVGEVEEG